MRREQGGWGNVCGENYPLWHFGVLHFHENVLFCSTNLVLPHDENCYKYTWLNGNSRNKNSGSAPNCDNELSGWYRFGGGAGIKMATSCVPSSSCGTDAPGWMNGAHPTVDDGKVIKTVCFTWEGNCCLWAKNIKVVNCGQYYVYELISTHPSNPCFLRYCGSDNWYNCVIISKQTLFIRWTSSFCMYSRFSRL